MLKAELDLLEKERCWTDSTTVIRYINNDKARFQTFVPNWVQAIGDKTDNPADDVSRGMKINSFLKQQRCIKGPSFLWKSDTEWPEYSANVKEISNDDIETKTAHSTTVEQKDILEHLEISPNGTVWGKSSRGYYG